MSLQSWMRSFLGTDNRMVWRAYPVLKRKKDMVIAIKKISDQQQNVAQLVEDLRRLAVYNDRNRGYFDTYDINDVVVALVEHTGLELQKQHTLTFSEDKPGVRND